MTFFPDRLYSNCGTYADQYFERCARAAATVDRPALHRAATLLIDTIMAGRLIFSCGNGGSAAIANHLVCDHMKGVRACTALKPRVVSLSSTIEIITAVANDIGIHEVFAYQLRAMATRGDLLIAISSSGMSSNIVSVMEEAREIGVTTVAMTGFTGGKVANLADVSLYVDDSNYGVVEDVHQSLMHILAQYVRHAYVDESILGIARF